MKNYAGKSEKSQLLALDRVVSNKKQMLVVMHNNPDPDALSSAMALGYLMRQRYALETSIAYRGLIGRAENQAMVRQLKIQLKQFNRIRLNRYDCLALVDGQPYAGNTPDLSYNIVIDHHSLRKDTKADFLLVDPDIGGTATLIVRWYELLNLGPPKDVGTALTYGISSETQDLGRDASLQDIQAYLYVYRYADMRRLSRIIRPKLPKSYFRSVHQALEKALVYRNTLFAYLSDVPNVEIIAEMADFFLRYKRIGWSFVMGKHRNSLVLSIRSTHLRANAGEIVKKLVPDPDSVGGHDRIAGGSIDITGYTSEQTENLIKEISQRFSHIRGFKNVAWKPFLVQA